nr:MAG TPA: hypothetical protein [Caudoviricetes sp.]
MQSYTPEHAIRGELPPAAGWCFPLAFFHIDFVCDRFRCKSILFVNFQDVIIISKLAIVAQNVSL